MGKSAVKFLLLTAAVAWGQSTNDWLIVPGVRVGPLREDTSEEDLRRIFGDANVKQAMIDVGEGFQQPGTVIFGQSPQEMLKVEWKDPETRIEPKSVRICDERPSRCRWRTPDGISIGTDLRALEIANGSPFELAGFGWEYGGTVLSWDAGKLPKSFHVRLTDQKRGPQELEGDYRFFSSNAAMRAVNPVIYWMLVEF